MRKLWDISIAFSLGLITTIIISNITDTSLDNKWQILAQKQNRTISLQRKIIDKQSNVIKSLKIKGDFRNLLIESIIKCESSGNPKALRAIKGHGKDVGYFQINTFYHGRVARKMGLNLYNPIDNLEYGMYLLNKEGTKPWRASKRCWSPLLRKKISQLTNNFKRG